MGDFSVILLAAGSGSRMGTDTKKQYLTIEDRPLIAYPLQVLEVSDAAEVVLVVSPGDEAYVRREIVEAYGFHKVSAVVPGGSERYLSVYNGLQKVSFPYVLVHDGARCCVTGKVIEDAYAAAVRDRAAVVVVPSVDTVKIADEEGYVAMTPERARVWSIQTPQAFATEVLRSAYERVMADSRDPQKQVPAITDDAMIVEYGRPDVRVRLVGGDYNNIKVTTPKDLEVAKTILNRRRQ